MLLPRWAHRGHPVVQRELAAWARYRSGLRVMAAVLAAALGLSLLSDLMTIFAPAALGYFFMYLQSLPGAAAVLVLKAFLLAASALSIARDYESRSWDALRLTGLRPVELLAARAAALVRLVWFPVVCWITLNVLLTLVFLFRRLSATRFGDLAPLPGSLFFLVFDAALPCAIVALYLALGLLISTLARTQANALAASISVLGLLVVAGWIGDWIDLRFQISFTLGSLTSTLLEFGWAAALSAVLYRLAEWRVARGMKPIL